MSLKPKNYMPRLIDKNISNLMDVAGAISIEGPKWCGKTYTSLAYANSTVNMDDRETRERFELNSDLILNDEKPELIDEWTREPEVWDKVRRKCDELQTKGNYILSCSTSLNKNNEEVFHSGAGRIVKTKMSTMSLYETGDSTGEISIMDMYNGKEKNITTKRPTLEELANFIVRGGWPANLNVSKEKAGILPKAYINNVLDKDIYDDKNRDRHKMEMLLKSLARNESTIVTNNTLIRDISDFENYEIDKNTVSDYLNVLERLYLVNDTPSYSENYRSPERVGKNPKRHLVDPSLPCALMNLNTEKLVKDLRTFGLFFEALVEHDLDIYMTYLGGKLYHFRDNVTGQEVDAILEFEDGEYAAAEIKLGFNQFEEAKNNLVDFASKMKKKPKFMCVIAGYNDVIARDKETGVYVVPITALKAE